jgi:Protein of unknown function (DUF3306)
MACAGLSGIASFGKNGTGKANMSRVEDSPETEGSFLGRWARRKQAAQTAVPEQNALTQPIAEAAPSPDSTADEQLPMPSLDSIVPGSDVSAFFQAHVPDALRTAALRKLWVTDPEIKGFIEMADYQWDFNNPDSMPGWSSTVGKLDVKRMLEQVMSGSGPQQARPLAANLTVEPVKATEELPDQTVSERHEELGENTESAINSGTSATSIDASDLRMIQNDAVQNSTKESSVYDISRKRGGSALPT